MDAFINGSLIDGEISKKLKNEINTVISKKININQVKEINIKKLKKIFQKFADEKYNFAITKTNNNPQVEVKCSKNNEKASVEPIVYYIEKDDCLIIYSRSIIVNNNFVNGIICGKIVFLNYNYWN